MEAIDAQLRDLQRELEKCEAEIANAQEAFQDAQKKFSAANRHRGEVAARIAALKSEADEVRASRSAIANERKTAAGEINDAKKLLQDTVAQLEKKAPKDRPKAVADAAKSVDDEIGDKKKTVDELRNKLSEAEKTLAEAQNQASLHEKAAGESKTLLKNLVTQVKAAQGRVATLKNTIQSATKNGKTTEALYLVEQLKQAMGELEKLVDPKREEELVSQQLDHQQKATAAKADMAKKSTECAQLRQGLTVAERDYQAKAKWRETAIKTKLAALPEGEPQPYTGEVGTPASGGAGYFPGGARERDPSASGSTGSPTRE